MEHKPKPSPPGRRSLPFRLPYPYGLPRAVLVSFGIAVVALVVWILVG
jgi:hypothetical protein